jgi:hypothetical protein
VHYALASPKAYGLNNAVFLREQKKTRHRWKLYRTLYLEDHRENPLSNGWPGAPGGAPPGITDAVAHDLHNDGNKHVIPNAAMVRCGHGTKLDAPSSTSSVFTNLARRDNKSCCRWIRPTTPGQYSLLTLQSTR